MNDQTGRIVWRVRAPDGAQGDQSFDALALPTDGRKLAAPGVQTRLIDARVPYEGELPDVPLTLIVRTCRGAGPLIVECEAFGLDGEKLVAGRATMPLAVIVRSAQGIIVSGLPSAPPDSVAPAA